VHGDTAAPTVPAHIIRSAERTSAGGAASGRRVRAGSVNTDAPGLHKRRITRFRVLPGSKVLLLYFYINKIRVFELLDVVEESERKSVNVVHKDELEVAEVSTEEPEDGRVKLPETSDQHPETWIPEGT
jgi:hypothetical protein